MPDRARMATRRRDCLRLSMRSCGCAARGGGLALWEAVARRLSTILVIGATLLGPHAATAAAAGGMSVVVFVDFSASVRGPERASFRFELEREILPALGPGDRIVIAPIHHRTLTAFRPLAEASLPTPPVFNGWLDNQLKYERQVAATEKVIADARTQLARDVTSIFARPYASPYTDIFSSLVMTEKIFAGDPRRRVLILMSDMIEDNPPHKFDTRSEEHTSELQSHVNLVCRLLLEKKKKNN